MVILDTVKAFLFKFKVYAIIIGVLIFAGLIGTIVIQNKSIKAVQNELSISKANEKISSDENSDLNKQKGVYQLTIRDLNYSKDSVIIKLKNTQKALGIKDKDLVSLQYYVDNFLKTDTTRLRDTTFVKGLDVDTLIGDKFYSLRLHLKYPNLITDAITFTNEKDVIGSVTRETINPPYKFFLWRWFQKKQTILIMNVKDSNPYLIGGKSRFIQVLK